MSFRSRAAAAAAVVATVLFSSSALAAKPAGDCVVAFVEGSQGALIQLQLSGIKKYCPKAPDAEKAAKLAEQLTKKINKACEKANKKIEKLDCANNTDPDATPIMPVTCPVINDPAVVESFLLSLNEPCDGIVTP